MGISTPVSHTLYMSGVPHREGCAPVHRGCHGREFRQEARQAPEDRGFAAVTHYVGFMEFRIDQAFHYTHCGSFGRRDEGTGGA